MVVMISPVAAPKMSLRSAMPACSPQRSSSKVQLSRGQLPTRLSSSVSASSQPDGYHVRDGDPACQRDTAASRRDLLFSTTVVSSVAALSALQPAAAVQGITAGRLPGVSKEADAEGFLTYQRPEGKSGGHGVGWTEIPRYSFKVPPGWEETPVSIADLGGTEIDLRYANRKEGSLVIVVAPVMRFKDIGFNADISLEDIGPPDRLILGFAPEIIGSPLPDDSVGETQVVQKDGRTYYQWQVTLTGSPRPYRLVAATAVGNRAFLLGVTANGRQWRAAEDKLRTIQDSFFVPESKV